MAWKFVFPGSQAVTETNGLMTVFVGEQSDVAVIGNTSLFHGHIDATGSKGMVKMALYNAAGVETKVIQSKDVAVLQLTSNTGTENVMDGEYFRVGASYGIGSKIVYTGAGKTPNTVALARIESGEVALREFFSGNGHWEIVLPFHVDDYVIQNPR